MGMVVLVFIILMVLIFIPFKQAPFLSTPRPTKEGLVLSTPIPTRSLETPNSILTPTSTSISKPTLPNTRVPTPTARPSKTPTTPFVLKIPTLMVYPTATEIYLPEPPPPPLPTAPIVVKTAVKPLEYRIRFEAKKKTIMPGECTDLTWQVQGGETVTLDGKSVSASGKEKVCPKKNVNYRLVVQLPNRSGTDSRQVTIEVQDEAPIDEP